MSGYVRIHRSLFGHPAFRNESETMAFAWMIGNAAWRTTRVRYKGHSLTLKRGQLAISQRDMAARFDRDKAWIERLWKRCKSEAMIETTAEAGVAVITICNYDEYQSDADEREAPAKAPREADNEAAARQRRGTEQRREEDNNTVPNGTARVDPQKLLFDLGVTVITASGQTEQRARSMVGKWRRDHGDDATMSALAAAKEMAVSEPIEWITKRLSVRNPIAASSSSSIVDQVLAEKEREERRKVAAGGPC